jgi:hypothetical protein
MGINRIARSVDRHLIATAIDDRSARNKRLNDHTLLFLCPLLQIGRIDDLQPDQSHQ